MIERRIDAIDGLRAAAIAMVFLYHAWQDAGSPPLLLAHGRVALGPWIDRLPAGVDLFMVLSGFCLFWPIARRPGQAWDWREFARRRVRRIVPPYYASIVVMSFLPAALTILMRLAHQPARWQPLPSAWEYFTHLTFTHSLFPSTWSAIQGCYWSLGLEMQLYLVFPLVVCGFRRIGVWVTLPMILASVVYRAGVGVVSPHLTWTANFLLTVTFLGRWVEFAAGMLAAWIIVARKADLPAGVGWLLLVVAFVTYALGTTETAARARFVPVREMMLAVAFAATIVAVCCTSTPVRWMLETRAVVFVGTISYSAYLTHQNEVYYISEFARKLLHVEGAGRLALLLAVGLPTIVGISYIFHRAFERPFLGSAGKTKKPGSFCAAGPLSERPPSPAAVG